MASYFNLFFAIVISLAILFPITIIGTDFVVGDSSGWTVNYNYTAWAQGKKFYVGDKLVFNYPKGSHNVFKVNGTAFANCTKPSLDLAMTSGNDVITLAAEGKKWYICGVANHCSELNQKLVIDVSSASRFSSMSGLHLAVLAMTAILAVVLA
ncbi:blue copper protein 1b-like [Impatiens glandulifera]|uniref:blue copper protein 1b-like n=1 Tax=Impatiens glandulifera TaxID=253017 RepID=UPI001FB0772D|nr:blue copper protein 1b-like [Impatiens glandulifera]